MNFLKIVSGLCLIVIVSQFFAACRKSSYSYTFLNQSDKEIKLFVYQTEGDYNSGSSPLLNGSINPHGSFTIPSNILQANSNYYVDWYSSDLLYSNWGDSTQANTFTASGKSFYINPTQPNYMRNLALSYQDLKTNWVGVDAYDTANPTVSVWATMTSQMKYRVLNIQRGFTADYEYMDGNDSDKDNYTYGTRQYGDTVKIIFADEHIHTLTARIPATGNTRAIDTAYFSFYDKIYKLVKQH